MSRTRKYFLNGNSFNRFVNNSSDLFDFTMTGLMDNYYDSITDFTTDGTFKAICLSGMTSLDNTGGGSGANPGTVVGRYMHIAVRPILPIGEILPDPRKFNDPNMINSIITMHGAVYTARSDFEFTDHNPIQFGQVVNCYFEKGSITNSSFVGLRFENPNGTVIDQSYATLASIPGVQTLRSSFTQGASLMGSGTASGGTSPSCCLGICGRDISGDIPPVTNGVGWRIRDPSRTQLRFQREVNFVNEVVRRLRARGYTKELLVNSTFRNGPRQACAMFTQITGGNISWYGSATTGKYSGWKTGAGARAPAGYTNQDLYNALLGVSNGTPGAKQQAINIINWHDQRGQYMSKHQKASAFDFHTASWKTSEVTPVLDVIKDIKNNPPPGRPMVTFVDWENVPSTSSRATNPNSTANKRGEHIHVDLVVY